MPLKCRPEAELEGKQGTVSGIQALVPICMNTAFLLAGSFGLPTPSLLHPCSAMRGQAHATWLGACSSLLGPVNGQEVLSSSSASIVTVFSVPGALPWTSQAV